jgi:hypothetical protein
MKNRGDDAGAGRVEEDVIREGFDVYIGLQQAASQLTWYEPKVVPGLLQAGAYARTLIKAGNPGVGRGGDRPGRRGLLIGLADGVFGARLFPSRGVCAWLDSEK